MKNCLLLLFLVFLFSCVEDKTNSGYNCEDGDCIASFDNPTYLTLQDCKSSCGTGTEPVIKPGAVTFTLSWDVKRTCGNNVWFPCWDVDIGVGYSQSDVDKEAYFNHKSLSDVGTFTVTNLPPGTYYYRAKKTIRQTCFNWTTGCEAPPPIVKSGKFTITSDRTTSISVTL